jgi:hypothetical protein
MNIIFDEYMIDYFSLKNIHINGYDEKICAVKIRG